MTNIKNIKIIFWGTPEFSVVVLEELKKEGFIPSLIITAPDKPVGRKYIITPPPVKIWAEKHNIECWQPNHPQNILDQLQTYGADIFIVASYGYILSQKILDIPKHGTLNVHTSLLPKYRGASPIESALLNNDTVTGSTIMKMTLGMDEGPIIAQSVIKIESDTLKPDLFNTLAHDGGKLLTKILPDYIAGNITPIPQNSTEATYCYKINKSDGDISNDSDQIRWNKYRAYYGWPGIFFFEDKKRIKITKARFENGKFIIERVIPEGKIEMEYKN